MLKVWKLSFKTNDLQGCPLKTSNKKRLNEILQKVKSLKYWTQISKRKVPYQMAISQAQTHQTNG